MSKDYIIGIDHGNGFIKTAGAVFASGVEEYKVEPPMLDGVLKYQDRYYVIGENRKAYHPDKTLTQDYYLLTLTALAKEIDLRRYPREGGSYILACGLPIEFFGGQRDSFQKYLQQKKEIYFQYSGRPYHVKVKKAIIYPQGYAVIAPRIKEYDGRVNIIDVGSGTIDILQLIDRKPQLSKCISLPMGILTCIDEIQKYFRMKYNTELDDYSIQNVLQMKTGDLPDDIVKEIQELIRDYITKALAELEQKGINFRFQKCCFCCGGSTVFKNYGELTGKNISFLTDISANAKGFEWLCKGMEKNAG